jgi:hypothetical protein
MNAKLHPQAPAGLPGAAAPAGPAAAAVADQACCCVARAVVRVIMPPAPGRPHETELLLCGHHYRVSRDALSAAHAQVRELHASAEATGAWFNDGHDRPAYAAASADNPGL